MLLTASEMRLFTELMMGLLTVDIVMQVVRKVHETVSLAVYKAGKLELMC